MLKTWVVLSSIPTETFMNIGDIRKSIWLLYQSDISEFLYIIFYILLI